MMFIYCVGFVEVGIKTTGFLFYINKESVCCPYITVTNKFIYQNDITRYEFQNNCLYETGKVTASVRIKSKRYMMPNSHERMDFKADILICCIYIYIYIYICCLRPYTKPNVFCAP